jgi:hypothetical protein
MKQTVVRFSFFSLSSHHSHEFKFRTVVIIALNSLESGRIYRFNENPGNKFMIIFASHQCGIQNKEAVSCGAKKGNSVLFQT